MKLGEKLQRLRKQGGLSQEELAGRLGVSRQAVSKWELGEAIPDTDNVVQLSRLFGVSCDYLLRDEVDQRGAPLPAPGETHLDRQGWVHNATVLSLAVCAMGLLLTLGGGVKDTSAGPAAIGLIIQLGGILLFELAAPRMNEDRVSARLNFYRIACWLVVPVLTVALNRWAFWLGRSVWWSAEEHLVLELIISGTITAALTVFRHKMRKVPGFGQNNR